MARLIAARRTAVVPRNGAFARLSLEDLAAPVLLACLADAGIAPSGVHDVILANALGAGGNPARRASLAAGLPETVAGLSIDRQCAGGLDAILLAKAIVDSGAADVILAGGVESYSRRPLRLRTDISTTIFFSDPDEYEGGDLVIEDTYGEQRVKLAAGWG